MPRRAARRSGMYRASIASSNETRDTGSRRERRFLREPQRPDVVKRLRRSSAALRSLRDDDVAPMRLRGIHCLCYAKTALKADFAQQRPWSAKGLSRAERSRLASTASDARRALGLDGEHGSGTQDSKESALAQIQPENHPALTVGPAAAPTRSQEPLDLRLLQPLPRRKEASPGVVL